MIASFGSAFIGIQALILSFRGTSRRGIPISFQVLLASKQPNAKSIGTIGVPPLRVGMTRSAMNDEISSDSLQFRPGALVTQVACVERAPGFNQDDVDLLLRHRTVFHPARNNIKLALFNRDVAIAQLHQQAALGHQEQFVFVVMMMPDEFALQLHHFYVAVVDLANNAGVAVIAKAAEFLCEIDLLIFHVSIRFWCVGRNVACYVSTVRYRRSSETRIDNSSFGLLYFRKKKYVVIPIPMAITR